MQGARPHMLGCCGGIWGTGGRRAVLGGGTWVKKIKSQGRQSKLCPLNIFIVGFPFYIIKYALIYSPRWDDSGVER